MATGATQRKKHTNSSAKSMPSSREHHTRNEKEGALKRFKYPLIAIWVLLFLIFFVYFGKDRVLNFARNQNHPPASQKRENNPQSHKKKEAPQKKGNQLKSLMNKHDKSISDVLIKASKLLDQGKIEESLREFTFLSSKYPKSPLARYKKAQAMDKKAYQLRSNDMLLEATKVFEEAADIENCPVELKKLTLTRKAELLAFIGRYITAAKTLERVATIFSADHEVYRSIGVNYLMSGQTEKALAPFKQVLELNPSDGHAKSHIGFVLKALDKLEECIRYFEEGIHSGYAGADDSKFYYHLGDAYSRIGKPDEARRVYEEGAKKGIFLSALQRSLYNANTPLKAQPWWTHRETKYGKHLATLEKNWKIIRDEALTLLDTRGQGGFEDESEKLQDTGDWKQLTLFQRGQREHAGCRRAPKTCEIISGISDATGCLRGQIKFSVMYPGTHVWPHTGPTNCRLRAHLGLVIPKNVFIRAGDETRTWQEGKVLVFDDSFEHEVWHNGTSFRLILIIDFWHPDLTAQQRRKLSPI